MILAGAIGLQGEAAAQARKACELPNPAYDAWQRRGSHGYAPAAYICAERRVGPWALFPRHFPGSEALQLDDRRTLPEAQTQRQLLWALRDYQEEALQSWLQADGDGIVEAPCGAGKTLIGCAALAAVQTPALILVHTRDLARQWIFRLSQCLEGAQIGEIRSGRDERAADICVATLQSLARWEWSELVRYGRTRGLVIVDEAHHIPAETFSRVLLGLAARYRLGLTATPQRADGLTPLLHWTLGETVHQIDRSVLQADGFVLMPEIRTIWTHFEPVGTEPHQRRRELAEDAERNQLIINTAMRLVKERSRVLILCDLVEHAQALAVALTLQDVPSFALVGKCTAKQRAEALAEMQAGSLQVLCATSLADEGLDLPELDAVILAAPSGNVARVEQRIGRVLRPSEGKAQPIVCDLVDNYGPYQGYYKKRQRLYAARGWV